MAWDATQRQKVHEKRSQGVVAVHMEKDGCDVTARVVDCVGTVTGTSQGPYDFKWYYSSDTVLADSQREAYTKLPLGAASLGAELGAGRSLRVDYIMAGSYVLPDALSISGWIGSECREATHFVKRVVVGGFARASGERDQVHADIGLFGVGAGAGQQTSQLHWRTEGSPTACKEAEQKQDVSAGCDMPLRLELKPIPGREPVAQPVPPPEEPVAETEPVRPAPTPPPTRTATPPPPPPPRDTSCPSGMASIAGGSFMMGSNDGDSDEKPVHRVTVSGFCMDVTEVTVDAYRRCVSSGACTNPDTGGSCNWGKSDKGSHPINCVDWNQATKYCAWAGGRLPTEEEWEYAARGGSKGLKYPWGSEAPGRRACWDGEGNDLGKGNRQGTCVVGGYAAGAFGLRDMAGNVWEWTSSNYSDDYSKDRASSDRVYRGGCWIGETPSDLRGANRYYGVTPDFRFYYLGFRCARTR